MSINESDLRKLPAVPALAFAVRCALLASPNFVNRWDDHYEDAVNNAIRDSMNIASSPQGTKIMGPDGYADFCVDLSGLATGDNLTACSSAANSAAGAAYCAAIIADIYNGYETELPEHYISNVQRAVNSASNIQGLGSIIEAEFKELIQQIDREGLTDFSPIEKNQMQNGFHAP